MHRPHRRRSPTARPQGCPRSNIIVIFPIRGSLAIFAIGNNSFHLSLTKSFVNSYSTSTSKLRRHRPHYCPHSNPRQTTPCQCLGHAMVMLHNRGRPSEEDPGGPLTSVPESYYTAEKTIGRKPIQCPAHESRGPRALSSSYPVVPNKTHTHICTRRLLWKGSVGTVCTR